MQNQLCIKLNQSVLHCMDDWSMMTIAMVCTCEHNCRIGPQQPHYKNAGMNLKLFT